MSYIPLIAPSTTLQRVKFLVSIADTFIYVVSKVGPTQQDSQALARLIRIDGDDRLFGEGRYE